MARSRSRSRSRSTLINIHEATVFPSWPTTHPMLFRRQLTVPVDLDSRSRLTCTQCRLPTYRIYTYDDRSRSRYLGSTYRRYQSVPAVQIHCNKDKTQGRKGKIISAVGFLDLDLDLHLILSYLIDLLKLIKIPQFLEGIRWLLRLGSTYFR